MIQAWALFLPIGPSPDREETARICKYTMQYAWIVTYPDNGVSSEMHVPVGREVLVNISQPMM